MVFERIKLWLRFYHPSETEKVLKEHKGKGTLKAGLINVLLSSLVPAITLFVLSMLMGLYIVELVESGAISNEDVPGVEEFGVDAAAVLGVIYAVVAIIALPLVLLIGHGLLWVLAKALGGTGDYGEQYYFGSFVMGIGNIMFPVYFIPYIGNLVVVALLLYNLFLNFKIVKAIHGVSKVKAAIVVLITAIISSAFFYAVL